MEQVMRVIVYPYPGQVFGQPLPNDWHTPGIELKAQLEHQGFTVLGEHEAVPDPDKDIAIYFDAILRQHVTLHKRSIYIAQEPPVIVPRFYERIKGWPYSRILTFSRKHCGGNVSYLPYPATQYRPSSNEKRGNLVAITANKDSIVQGNLYGVRRELYQAIGDDLDLYGHGWENIAGINWLGSCEHNYRTYCQYKTAISIENQYLEGYASEKYWTPKQAGCELQRIGWKPDYRLEDCNESGWAMQVVANVLSVTGE